MNYLMDVTPVTWIGRAASHVSNSDEKVSGTVGPPICCPQSPQESSTILQSVWIRKGGATQ